MGWDEITKRGRRLGPAQGRAMKELGFDAVVIGGGRRRHGGRPRARGARARPSAVVEREERLGGILGAVHPQRLRPHRVRRGAHRARVRRALRGEDARAADLGLLRLHRPRPRAEGEEKIVACVSAEEGVLRLRVAGRSSSRWAAASATGATSAFPASRPAGVFTAGLAQRLVNVEGYVPGQGRRRHRLGRHRPHHGEAHELDRLQGPRRRRDTALSLGAHAQHRPVPPRFRHSPLPLAPDHEHLRQATGSRASRRRPSRTAPSCRRRPSRFPATPSCSRSASCPRTSSRARRASPSTR